MQAEVHTGDALDAGVEEPGDVGRRVGIVCCISGRRRLIELDPLATGGGELADLMVQCRHECLGKVRSVGVVVDRTDECGQRERAGQRDLDRGRGARRGIGELLDSTHSVRHSDGPDRLLYVAHVERHGAHLPRCATIAQARHTRCEGPHEAGPAHLTVADDVEPGLLLVEDRPIDGVVERFLDVDRAEPVGLHQFLGRVEPRRMGIATDNGRGQEGKTVGHAWNVAVVTSIRRSQCVHICCCDRAAAGVGMLPVRC